MKDLEATQERFRKAEQDYAKKLEDMKLANAKRKRTMQMSEAEKQNNEKLSKVPEENKVKYCFCYTFGCVAHIFSAFWYFTRMNLIKKSSWSI